VFAGVTNGRQLLSELREMRRAWADRVAARQNSGVWLVADLLLRHPVVDASLVARELGRSRTDRRRKRVWRSPEVLAALDAFAARARPRT